LLVKEEVAAQLGALQARSPRFLNQINQVELVALALNHLPSLYATSHKGVEFQRQRGKAKYAAPIKESVQRALATIMRDPLRTTPPLQPQGAEGLEWILKELRSLLKNEALTWDTLPMAVERALKQAQEGTVSRSSRQTVYEALRTPGYRRPAASSYSAYGSGSDSGSDDTTLVLNQANDAWGNQYR
jgi:hypothetical protein